jgi:hypothetical protein
MIEEFLITFTTFDGKPQIEMNRLRKTRVKYMKNNKWWKVEVVNQLINESNHENIIAVVNHGRVVTAHRLPRGQQLALRELLRVHLTLNCC